MRIELIQVPVSDIDRAKAFYVEKVGFTADHDHRVSDELRFVQLTPPGSACSIALTSGAHSMRPGTVEGLQMVVEDAEDARTELAGRGVDVSDVQVFPWGSFVFFDDPDGNGWALQAMTHRDAGTGDRANGQWRSGGGLAGLDVRSGPAPWELSPHSNRLVKPNLASLQMTAGRGSPWLVVCASCGAPFGPRRARAAGRVVAGCSVG